MSSIVAGKKYFLSWLLLVVSLGAAVGASASSQEDSHGLFGMSLEELLTVPVKSATLTELDILSAPSSISLFHHQQFELMGVEYLHELINFVPGFQAFRQGDGPNEYYPSARGRRTGSSSREILVLVDGQRQNRGIDGSLAVPVIALAGIEKIEFIRGPGSALYGSNAFMGVIDITTKKGENNIVMAVSAGDASAKTFQALGSYPLGDWSVDVQLMAYMDNGQHYDVVDTFNGQPITVTDPHAGTTIRLSATSPNSSITYFSERRSSENFYLPDITAEGISRTDNPVDGLRASHRWQAADALNLMFIGAYTQRAYEGRFLVAPEGALSTVSNPPSSDAFIAEFEQSERNIMGGVQADWQWRSTVSFQGGLEWRKGVFDELKLLNNYDLAALSSAQFPVDFYGDTKRYTTIYHALERSVLAGYLQAQARVNDDWALTLGARFDKYSSNGSAYSPRLAVVRTLTANQSIKFLYGEAFRAPTINETAADNNVFVTGNPNLEPEKVNTYELVWVGAWGARQASVSLFENHFSHGIYQRVEGNNRIFANSDGHDRAQGAEAEYSQQLNDAWQLRASASRVWSPLAEGYRLADTTGSLTVNYQRNHWNMNIGWVVSGSREQAVPSGARIAHDGYQWMTAKLRYKWAEKRDLWLQVKNVTDADYKTPAQSESLEYGLPNRGRELSVGLSLSF